MGDTATTKKTYTIVTIPGQTPGTYIQYPVDVTPKGVATFEIDLAEAELIESGTKMRDGTLVRFEKYRVKK